MGLGMGMGMGAQGMREGRREVAGTLVQLSTAAQHEPEPPRVLEALACTLPPPLQIWG